ncbi:MAG: hypothetical protein EA370_02990 [Wenzhouxiangella sp.]|nr:MAG: hypothetical protein EA370_02990 [Wenzhouxiangella sp.]
MMAAGLLFGAGSGVQAADELDEGITGGAPVSTAFVSVFRPQVGTAARRSGRDARFLSTEGTASYNCNNTSPGGARIIRYPFSVPDSRLLDSVRVWGVKGANTQPLTMTVYRSCMSQSQFVPTTNVLAVAVLNTNPGQFVQSLNVGNESPLSLDCRYWLEIQFGDSAQACASSNANLRIFKMRVESLAPAPDPIFHDRFLSHAVH